MTEALVPDESTFSDNTLVKESINPSNSPPPQFTTLQKFNSELIGTFWLMSIGCGIGVLTGNFDASCIGGSIILSPLIYVFGRVSGAHFNPAVSIPFCLLGKITVIELLVYILAQIIACFLAFLSIAILRNWKFDNLAGNQMQQYLIDLDKLSEPDTKCYISAFLCEIFLTFILVLTVISSTIKENNYNNLTGIIVPITLGCLLIAGANLSGASLNPARSFAPAVMLAITGNGMDPLKQLWIYSAGPIIGGVLGGYVAILFEMK